MVILYSAAGQIDQYQISVKYVKLIELSGVAYRRVCMCPKQLLAMTNADVGLVLVNKKSLQ